MDEQIPVFGTDEWEKEKKGILSDLRSEREKRHQLEEQNTSLSQRLAVIEESLDSAGSDGENPQDRVNRLAQDPDSYISNHLVNFEETTVKPLKETINSMMIDRQVEKGLRWVAKQEKKDYEDVEGSELEEELARVTQNMRTRGIIPTNPTEGIKEAYRLLQVEREEKDSREKERSGKIEGNRTESVTPHTRSGSHIWTRAEIQDLSSDEFTKNETEIKRQMAQGLIK